MNVTPSDAQSAAIRAIRDWFRSGTRDQQVFRLFGYAGTGKSTVLNVVLDDLGLEPHAPGAPGYVVATFTGKAALVLRRKGAPARTIHSLIYTVKEATEAEIEALRLSILDDEAAALALPYAERLGAEAIIEGKRHQLSAMKHPRFVLNAESEAADAALIVLDEVSMVGHDMARDLLSFGKPILVLGDPGQLPPIRGEGAFTDVAPDVMLTEIHRQAAESAILRLATMARQGRPIPYGRHDDHVWKMRRGDLSAGQMLKGGQVICGKNATRLDINNHMRHAAGLWSGVLPGGPDEKIICLKNQNDLGLINGMFLTLTEITDDAEHSFAAKVATEDGVALPGFQRIYKGHFDDHRQIDPGRHDRDWKRKKSLVEATFGWAITCHKAQGSQWPNVIVYDDGLGRTDLDRSRWLYTAITRAETGLVLLA